MRLDAIANIGLAVFVTFALAASLSPNTSAQPSTEKNLTLNTTELTLITLNLAHGRATSFSQLLLANNRFLPNINAVAATLSRYKPDIVALQEADEASSWSGNFNHVAYLAQTLEFEHLAHSIHINNSMASYGTAVISRLPIINKEAHTFASSWPTPSKGFTLATVSWQIDMNAPPVEVRVVSLHLDFSRQSVRANQIGELVEILRKENTPLIIMGDFNNEEIAARTLPEALRKVGIQVNSFEPDNQALNSYKKRRLDWILISSTMAFSDYRVIDAPLSDHNAVVARIRWLPAANTQPTP